MANGRLVGAEACAVLALENPEAAVACLLAIGISYIGPIVGTAIVNFINSLSSGGGSNVACNSTHSSKVQGPGTCCLAVQSGALIPPAPGTILPVYTPGSAGTLPPGRIAQVTDSAGHCASCMIVGSSSAKHRGRPVLKYIRGGPTCPTSQAGCCTLQGTSI